MRSSRACGGPPRGATCGRTTPRPCGGGLGGVPVPPPGGGGAEPPLGDPPDRRGVPAPDLPPHEGLPAVPDADPGRGRRAPEAGVPVHRRGGPPPPVLAGLGALGAPRPRREARGTSSADSPTSGSRTPSRSITANASARGLPATSPVFHWRRFSAAASGPPI